MSSLRFIYLHTKLFQLAWCSARLGPDCWPRVVFLIQLHVGLWSGWLRHWLGSCCFCLSKFWCLLILNAGNSDGRGHLSVRLHGHGHPTSCGAALDSGRCVHWEVLHRVRQKCWSSWVCCCQAVKMGRYKKINKNALQFSFHAVLRRKVVPSL